MKRKIKGHIFVALVAIMLSGMTVCAAPKTMPDGQTFDAEFYAKTYPDVVAALGSSESALYSHYVNYGKAEGRLPYENAPQPQTANTTGELPDGITLHYWTNYEDLGNGTYLQGPLQIEVISENGTAYQLTDKDVIDIAKDTAPNGTEWGYETYYDTISNVKGRNIAKRGQGCLAFAYWLTDAIFGTTPMVRYENTEDNMLLNNGTFEYCMYDIVQYVTTTGSFHAGVVIGADAKTQTLYLAEGNVNGVVNWNRSIKVDGSDGNKIARVYRRG